MNDQSKQQYAEEQEFIKLLRRYSDLVDITGEPIMKVINWATLRAEIARLEALAVSRIPADDGPGNQPLILGDLEI